MAWLAFTKKAQTKNIALRELKHLFKMLEATSGVPESFWHDPYAVGFVYGYTMGAGIFVGGKGIKPADVAKATVDVLFDLAPDQVLEAAKRWKRWHDTKDPHIDEGQKNGATLALFLLGTNAADKEPVVIEARRRARHNATVLTSLAAPIEERGEVGIVLRQMLFYDRIQKLR
jgi:hypothetical protein